MLLEVLEEVLLNTGFQGQQHGKENVTVRGLKALPNLSSGLTGIPRSPVRSLRVRSSICSWTGRNQVMKENKKNGKRYD